MRKPMRKVTLAIAMLPLLTVAPAMAASVSSQQGGVQLAQAGDASMNQFTQQVCNLAHQNAQSYSRILQLRDRLIKIERDNEARFLVLEKDIGGASSRVNVGSTAILDDVMQGGGGGGQNGAYQSPGMMQELVRNLTGKVEDVDAQIAFTNDQLQKTQEDNEFRFEELEKKKGVTSQGPSGAGQFASAAEPAGANLCAQGMANPADVVATLGMRVEAMNFQILELQDQMQKLQENYERRFEALETGKRADAGARPIEEAGGSDQALASSGAPQGADSVAIGSGTAAQGESAGGEPPHTLGSIRFDTNGNVIGETMNSAPGSNASSGQTGVGQRTGQDNTSVASLPTVDNPKTLYEASYQYLMSGDYKAAESGFRQHVKQYPADPQTAEARFWLGESLYGQGRYSEAATVFIDTQRDYPDSRRAAENMFKLGMTLEKMDNHDVACATFQQIPQRYPKAAPAILKRVSEERARVKC
ncbi:tol-pal system protein YbgF [Brucella sp. BE17]|uniref:tol-pal system protein YbgF n=1 Tax=Brucella sp. BE17 TaxID=3142977 RepID=UPI0031B9B66C